MRRSLRSWLWRVPVEEEVDEELALHVELRTRELVARGVEPAAAREMALARIGDLSRLKRTCVDLGRTRDRGMRITRWFDELAHDVTFAIRQLKGAPGFTVVAIVTLALGVGVNSAIFALADATLFRPLPFPREDRLVMIVERTPTEPFSAVSPGTLRDWAADSRSFAAMAGVALGAGGGPMLAGPDGAAESVERQWVTSRFFDVLGVQPVAGRTFGPEDDGPVSRTVIITEGLWRTRFNADSSIVGGMVRLAGQPHTVIGVVPDHAQLTMANQIWTLLPDLGAGARTTRMLRVVGRLNPGVSLEAAQSDLDAINDALGRAYPATSKDRFAVVEPFRRSIMGRDLELTSLFLIGVVGFVLLLCCANVANLMLARATARGREVAIRAALGAGRLRIVRQLLTESLVLASVGGVIGIVAGDVILRAAPSFMPVALLPPAARLTFDLRVILFSLGTALSVGVLFGLLPAWQATRGSLVRTIATESRSATRGGGRFRHTLVAGEVAAAVLLLCGAGLLVRTLVVLGSFDNGYRAERTRVLTFDFSLPVPRPNTPYPTFDSLLQFYRAVGAEVAALPGVAAAGWTTSVPPLTFELAGRPVAIAGDAPLPPESQPITQYAFVDPGYFETLDLPIVAGRGFTERDSAGTPPVCIVNEAFVRRHLQGRNPIGQQVTLFPSAQFPGEPLVKEIIGVARQVKGRPDEKQELVQLYAPLAQHPYTDTYLVMRTAAGPPEALVPAIRALVARRDPTLSVRRIRTLETLVEEQTAGYQFRAIAVAAFAALALVLAMVGVFGVLAYAVQQRHREFGIRMALGAGGSDLLKLVVGSAARVIAAGAVVGLVLAGALSRTIASFLFGVQPLDPVTFLAVPLVMTVTAILATAVPALRAVRVDPVTAIRE